MISLYCFPYPCCELFSGVTSVKQTNTWKISNGLPRITINVNRDFLVSERSGLFCCFVNLIRTVSIKLKKNL